MAARGRRIPLPQPRAAPRDHGRCAGCWNATTADVPSAGGAFTVRFTVHPAVQHGVHATGRSSGCRMVWSFVRPAVRAVMHASLHRPVQGPVHGPVRASVHAAVQVRTVRQSPSRADQSSTAASRVPRDAAACESAVTAILLLPAASVSVARPDRHLGCRPPCKRSEMHVPRRTRGCQLDPRCRVSRLRRRPRRSRPSPARPCRGTQATPQPAPVSHLFNWLPNWCVIRRCR